MCSTKQHSRIMHVWCELNYISKISDLCRQFMHRLVQILSLSPVAWDVGIMCASYREMRLSGTIFYRRVRGMRWHVMLDVPSSPAPNGVCYVFVLHFILWSYTRDLIHQTEIFHDRWEDIDIRWNQWIIEYYCKSCEGLAYGVYIPVFHDTCVNFYAIWSGWLA